jgi:hypothetical protein
MVRAGRGAGRGAIDRRRPYPDAGVAPRLLRDEERSGGSRDRMRLSPRSASSERMHPPCSAAARTRARSSSLPSAAQTRRSSERRGARLRERPSADRAVNRPARSLRCPGSRRRSAARADGERGGRLPHTRLIGLGRPGSPPANSYDHVSRGSTRRLGSRCQAGSSTTTGICLPLAFTSYSAKSGNSVLCACQIRSRSSPRAIRATARLRSDLISMLTPGCATRL